MKRKIKVIFLAVVLLVLITDSQHAVAAIAEGIQQCIAVIIPSLFPFFFISALLNDMLIGRRLPGLSSISRLLKIPEGGESILFLGLLGGYPVGAKAVGDAHKNKLLEPDSANSLLCYCSNAGPAFIFGMAGQLFPSLLYPVLIWLIHILSALLTGFLLPKPTQKRMRVCPTEPISVTQALQNSIRVTAMVCGWILLFKVLVFYLDNLTALLNIEYLSAILSGILELSNGCLSANHLDDLGLRFLYCSVIISFGGICVLLQTASVTTGLALSSYFLGKVMQAGISFLLAITVALFVLHDMAISPLLLLTTVLICIVITALRRIYIKRSGKIKHNAV